MVKFSSSEIQVIIIASVVLGVVFGYDDGQEIFQMSYWLTNLVLMTFFAFFSFIVYAVSHKMRAKRSGSEATMEIWSLSRFSFKPEGVLKGPIKKIPVGIIIPFILMILTKGALKFAAITSTQTKTISSKRIGKEFRYTTEFEEAQIALAGPLMALIVAFIAKALTPLIPGMEHLMMMNLYIALFNMIPLPKVDGLRVYFGSPFLFSFFLALIIVSFFFLRVVAVGTTFFIGLIIACAVVLLHYKYKYFNK